MEPAVSYPSSEPSYSEAVAVRLADEGVPIQAIGRALKQPPDRFREILNQAVACGRIISLPREDWPSKSTAEHRAPCHHDTIKHDTIKGVTSDEDNIICIKMTRVFHTTRLQSRVLLRLLRRGQCTKDAIHDVVEDNRGNPADPTDRRIVQVLICLLRKKLKPWGIAIKTIHSQGYTIAQEDITRVIDMIDRYMEFEAPHPGADHEDHNQDRNQDHIQRAGKEVPHRAADA